MKVCKTLKLKIFDVNTVIPTITLYNEALSFVVDICFQEKSSWLAFEDENRLVKIEKLIYIATNNPNSKYTEFNKKFYRIPSYFRHSIINKAIEIVTNYLSFFNTLQKNKRFHNKLPTLSYDNCPCPVFYKKGMLDNLCIDGTCCIELFIDNGWEYVDVFFDKRVLYSSGTFKFDGYTMGSPSLTSIDKIYLCIPFYKDIELSEEQNVITEVELDVISPAITSLITEKGESAIFN